MKAFAIAIAAALMASQAYAETGPFKGKDAAACKDGAFLAQLFAENLRIWATVNHQQGPEPKMPVLTPHTIFASCFAVKLQDIASKEKQKQADNDYVIKKAHQDELDMRAAQMAASAGN